MTFDFCYLYDHLNVILKPVYDLLLFLGCILKVNELSFYTEKPTSDKIKNFTKTRL